MITFLKFYFVASTKQKFQLFAMNGVGGSSARQFKQSDLTVAVVLKINYKLNHNSQLKQSYGNGTWRMANIIKFLTSCNLESNKKW